MTAQTACIIPYGHQSISEADIQAVVDVLKSDWLTQGPAIERFEDAVSRHCQAKFAVAVSSATAALHLSCLTLGLGPEDWLWTSPNTFVASANCGRYCGSKVDFVDIDPKTYNMSAEALAVKLELAEKAGRLPRVVVPVHFAGQSCEMDKIKALSDRYGFTVIEDASHAIGGTYKNQPIGGCQFADMTVFSFHPVKIITTGEGGMILTNNKELYEKLIMLRTHGITRNPAKMSPPPAGPWDYQQIDLGFNYRITDIQAALGHSQMQRLNEFVKQRHRLVDRYNAAFHGLPLKLPYQRPDTYSAYHLYVVCLKQNEAPIGRLEFFQKMQEAGIGVNVHYIPVHMQPYYRALGFAPGDFPEAEQYYAQAVTLPLYSDLSEKDQTHVIDTVRRLFGN
jgi:UDP-4-amino-4,6-dideoxy-N-acetyl-beta-L-altrosamine transaminase